METLKGTTPEQALDMVRGQIASLAKRDFAPDGQAPFLSVQNVGEIRRLRDRKVTMEACGECPASSFSINSPTEARIVCDARSAPKDIPGCPRLARREF